MKSNILRNKRTRSLFSQLNIYVAIALSALIKACGGKSLSSGGVNVDVDNTEKEINTQVYDSNSQGKNTKVNEFNLNGENTKANEFNLNGENTKANVKKEGEGILGFKNNLNNMIYNGNQVQKDSGKNDLVAEQQQRIVAEQKQIEEQKLAADNRLEKRKLEQQEAEEKRKLEQQRQIEKQKDKEEVDQIELAKQQKLIEVQNQGQIEELNQKQVVEKALDIISIISPASSIQTLENKKIEYQKKPDEAKRLSLITSINTELVKDIKTKINAFIEETNNLDSIFNTKRSSINAIEITENNNFIENISHNIAKYEEFQKLKLEIQLDPRYMLSEMDIRNATDKLTKKYAANSYIQFTSQGELKKESLEAVLDNLKEDQHAIGVWNSGSHWVAIHIINIYGNYLLLCKDSMDHEGVKSHKLKKVVDEFSKPVLEGKNYKITLKFNKDKNTKQDFSYECGLFAMENIDRMADKINNGADVLEYNNEFENANFFCTKEESELSEIRKYLFIEGYEKELKNNQLALNPDEQIVQQLPMGEVLQGKYIQLIEAAAQELNTIDFEIKEKKKELAKLTFEKESTTDEKKAIYLSIQDCINQQKSRKIELIEILTKELTTLEPNKILKQINVKLQTKEKLEKLLNSSSNSVEKFTAKENIENIDKDIHNLFSEIRKQAQAKLFEVQEKIQAKNKEKFTKYFKSPIIQSYKAQLAQIDLQILKYVYKTLYKESGDNKDINSLVDKIVEKFSSSLDAMDTKIKEYYEKFSVDNFDVFLDLICEKIKEYINKIPEMQKSNSNTKKVGSITTPIQTIQDFEKSLSDKIKDPIKQIDNASEGSLEALLNTHKEIISKEQIEAAAKAGLTEPNTNKTIASINIKTFANIYQAEKDMNGFISKYNPTPVEQDVEEDGSALSGDQGPSDN
jgi:hypothetical protein